MVLIVIDSTDQFRLILYICTNIIISFSSSCAPQPHSALDTENEFLVQEALERLMQDRTVLVIAHRLSTIQNADAVAVLDQQHVVECGSHAQLLTNQDGLFRKLMEKQALLHADPKLALAK